MSCTARAGADFLCIVLADESWGEAECSLGYKLLIYFNGQAESVELELRLQLPNGTMDLSTALGRTITVTQDEPFDEEIAITDTDLYDDQFFVAALVVDSVTGIDGAAAADVDTTFAREPTQPCPD